ncbi:MAG: hypothetical protein RBS73_09110 [Prolixibacteraceae bacterium]|jgi:PAS domain-containing protein|nr:hypothetical protein [Prolixibacteraceae bacterium]
MDRKSQIGNLQARIDNLTRENHFLHELEQTSEQLRQSDERARFIIDVACTGTWKWNVQPGETIFNENWVPMTGYIRLANECLSRYRCGMKYMTNKKQGK